MLAVPSSLALTGTRRAGFLLLVVGLLYWLMVGFRFQIGMDWNNYIVIYQWKSTYSLAQLLVDREPGYGLLTWIAAQTGGGMVFINAVSGLVFCWGLIAVARRCPEPWIAIAIATPLLVVAVAMSATRQAIAEGIIAYLFATWERRSTLTRIGLVVCASLFHFSALFVLVFVGLASRAPPLVPPPSRSWFLQSSDSRLTPWMRTRGSMSVLRLSSARPARSLRWASWQPPAASIFSLVSAGLQRWAKAR